MISKGNIIITLVSDENKIIREKAEVKVLRKKKSVCKSLVIVICFRNNMSVDSEFGDERAFRRRFGLSSFEVFLKIDSLRQLSLTVAVEVSRFYKEAQSDIIAYHEHTRDEECEKVAARFYSRKEESLSHLFDIMCESANIYKNLYVRLGLNLLAVSCGEISMVEDISDLERNLANYSEHLKYMRREMDWWKMS